MDNDIQQTADMYRLVAWAHANRKRLTLALVIVVIIAAAIGLWSWHKGYEEQQANAALFAVKLPVNMQETADPALGDAYYKVATDHSGTSAGARALLLSGSVYFNAGQFDKARGNFEHFLADYSDYPMTGQALVGVAASFEAAGKVAEATTKYEDLVKHHATEPMISEARSALARLYLAQNKPELALRYYQELDKENRPDSWTAEAKRQIAEVLTKYPALRKPVVSPTNSTPVIPTLTPTIK